MIPVCSADKLQEACQRKLLRSAGTLQILNSFYKTDNLLCQSFVYIHLICYNLPSMILVTGGTGFIGRELIAYLTKIGYPVRILLKPSQVSPNIPVGIPLEVAVCSLNDERGLRAAMKNVDAVFHLASAERLGSRARLAEVDVDGSANVARAGAEANLERIYFLSHLGADKASAYPVLKAKSLAEQAIIHSGVPYTIIRTSHVFGPGDQFTTGIYRLLKRMKLVFFLPGDGSTLLQPLYISDLMACFNLVMQDSASKNKTITIGGGEMLTYRNIVEIIMQKTSIRRTLISIPPAYLRMISLFVEQSFPDFPISLLWLDTLSADRTTETDILPRQFGLIPSRFHQNLDYLLVGKKA